MSKFEQRVRNFQRFKLHATGWLIMLPGIALFAFFIWAPLAQSVRLSFYRTRNIELVEFVGFDNYVWLFAREEFRQALTNTFSYTLWSLLIGFLVPIFLALVIGETVRSRGFFRTAAYLPNILPGLAAMILWSAFFSGDVTGVINVFRGWIGLEPTTFLTEANLVIPIIVVISTWRGAGATALIYMAGLAGINPELYEAATIDGAGVFKRIRHITIPAIFNLGSTLLLLQIIAIFQIMYEPLVLTGGGPDNASLSLMLLMWEYAFTPRLMMDFGRASAVAVITALILLVFAIIYSIVSRKRTEWD